VSYSVAQDLSSRKLTGSEAIDLKKKGKGVTATLSTQASPH